MRPGCLELDPEGDDMAVFEKQEKVRHATCPALLHERALHVCRSCVGDGAEATNLEGTHSNQ